MHEELVTITIDLAWVAPGKVWPHLIPAIEACDQRGEAKTAHVLRSIGKELDRLDRERNPPLDWQAIFKEVKES